MNRRHFLTASAASSLALGSTALTRAAASGSAKDLIELRLYHFDSTAQQEAFEAFLQQAAIPALNQAGVEPVGVFRLTKEDNPKLEAAYDHPMLFVLLTHKSSESVVNMLSQLTANETFINQGKGILQAPKATPAYKRFESSLFLAFNDAPRVEVVSRAPERILQLRIYESHNDERALKKIEMFNEGGEIAIFRRCGMPPVFFGQALIGSKLPNLTYLLAFDSAEAQTKAWNAFRDDPAWKALSGDEAYKDTVSTITNLILRPGPGSQI